MSEWWTYRLANFLMFSPQVYYRMFELHNRAWWPLPLIVFVLGALTLVLLFVRNVHAGRVVALLAALAWLFLSWAFFAQRYADIHLAGNAIAAAFALQGLLLLWAGVRRPFMARRDAAAAGGQLLFALALFAWPLLAFVDGRAWQQGEVLAMAPDPTAVATLGMLLVCGGHWLLWPLPVLWLLFSGVTLTSMDAALAWAPPVAVLAALLLAAHRRFAQRRRTT